MLDKFKRLYSSPNLDVTPPPVVTCFPVTIDVLISSNLTFNLTPCNGVATNYVLNNESQTICVESINSTPAGEGTDYTLTTGLFCRTPDPGIVTEQGLISADYNTSSLGVCSYTLPTTVFFENAVVGVINTGTTVYTTNTGAIPFVGNGKFYKVKINLSGIEAFAQINNSGVIITVGYC